VNKKACFKLFLLFLSLHTYASSPAYIIKNFSKGDYHAAYQNWDIVKGSDHFIYVANNSGLLEFDGISWNFYTSPEINNVRAVFYDEGTNRIYTSGYREMGYWVRDEFGILNYNSLTPLASDKFTRNEEFWKIVVFKQKIIFQSFQGLFVYDGEHFQAIRPQGFLNTMESFKGKLLLLKLNRGIFQLENNLEIPYMTGDFFNDKLVRFVLPWKNESMLIGTAENGVYRFDGEQYIREFPDHTDYFMENTINRACIYADSVLVVGTILDGLIGLDREGAELFRINELSGLQNNTVLSIESDEEGIWASLDRGIAYINLQGENRYSIHRTNNIGASYSAAVLGGMFYLGTNQGLYAKPKDAADDEFELVSGTQDQVWDCHVYQDQLFVSHNSGTFMIKDGELEKISDFRGGFCIRENSYQPNTLLQSTYSSILFFEPEQESWRVAHTIRNFGDLIRYIELDHLNNIWAAHMRRGVYKLSLNDRQDSVKDIRYYGKNSIFGQEYGIKVFKLENRIVFTTGSLLYTYDDIHDSIILYDGVNEAVGDYASAHRIIKAPDHHYWFINKEGCALFHFNYGNIELVREYPRELFGIHVIEDFENIIPVSRYEAIYCLENGYALLNADPVTNLSSGKVPAISLKSFSTFDKNGQVTRLNISKKRYTLPHSRNNLTLQYSYPQYKANSLKFYMKIEGLSEQWEESENNSDFQITRLPSGEYRILVYAENEWHQRSEIHQVEVRVYQPWYRSLLAWIIYLIILSALMIYVRNISVRRIEQRERKRRELKEQELIKLRNQNLRADLNFKTRELANSTMSIIKKNEFLLEMKDTLASQKYQLGTRFPDKFYNHIVKKIDQNIASGDDWKIFETNVGKAHEFFIQKMINDHPDLTHSDLRLCTYLRMNLSSKELAPLLNISHKSIEVHRSRLRKKLRLSGDDNLVAFLLEF